VTPRGRRQRARALLLDLDGVLIEGAVIDRVLIDEALIEGARDAGGLVDAGLVVAELLAFVREVRAHRVPVGLAVNTTSTLDDELTRLSLVDEFDAVVTSERVGAFKPSKEFFHAACLALGTPPPFCLYVDDEDRNVTAARVAGLSAHRWGGTADVGYLRAALGQ
jgi:FMN phosphatase YigB (HAD superfamily)